MNTGESQGKAEGGSAKFMFSDVSEVEFVFRILFIIGHNYFVPVKSVW